MKTVIVAALLCVIAVFVLVSRWSDSATTFAAPPPPQNPITLHRMSRMVASDTKDDRPSYTSAIQAQGVVKSVDVTHRFIVIYHQPIAQLNWPATVMEFGVSNSIDLGKIKLNSKIAFELQRQGGIWVITRLSTPNAAAAKIAAMLLLIYTDPQTAEPLIKGSEGIT